MKDIIIPALAGMLLVILAKSRKSQEQERQNQVANALKNIRTGQTFTVPVYAYIYYPQNKLYGRVMPETKKITATALSDARKAEDEAIEVEVNIDIQGKPPKLGR
jgi:hypothetical protein